MQAVMSADFAIAQFRYLVPLLLVHGRYSYKRISRMVLFFFYKNMLFGVTLFIFNAFNVFSGQFIYNDFYMTLYNVVFTALTPIVIGMFDRDVDKEMGLKYPGLYRQGKACAEMRAYGTCAVVLTGLVRTVRTRGTSAVTTPSVPLN
jgi:phospholipid-transporting ATPase